MSGRNHRNGHASNHDQLSKSQAQHRFAWFACHEKTASAMLTPAHFVVGLGSNLGDRLATLGAALESLGRLGEVLRRSSIYETAPVGPPQPAFLNAAALLESKLSPRDLLDGLLAIERAAGRERRERWGPRTLDLDILWSDFWVVSEPELTIPHPELRHRAFALVPLLDVVPDACDPHTSEPYSTLRAHDSAEIHEVLGMSAALPSKAHR